MLKKNHHSLLSIPQKFPRCLVHFKKGTFVLANQQFKIIFFPGHALHDFQTFSLSFQARGDEIMKKEAFNLVASDKMSLHRVVPDTRDPACRARRYDPPEQLPSASVVIIFTNEAWTPLLR